MKKMEGKEKVIACGVELISLNGYTATGIDAVLKQAGVPKGSFYHYFGTKENFGLEVINRFAEEYDRKLERYLGDTDAPPLQRIRNYLEHSVGHMAETGCSRGCLIGNLGQELAGQNERFRARLEEVFRSWQVLFAACLREARECGELSRDTDPDGLAEFILSAWEGAILHAKVMKSPSLLQRFIAILFETVLNPR
jgi:TetR/AcrR family transcriptional repressor of nem operon